MAQKYSEFRPSQFDSCGLGLEDRQDWLVAPVSQTRDSEVLTQSNFAAALKMLGGESESCEVHRFGHWGPGWFEIILVAPDCVDAVEKIESALAGYCVLDESDFSERETEAANEVWKDCFTQQERIAYIRQNRSQFDFQDCADMMGCVRGSYFAGYASELLCY